MSSLSFKKRKVHMINQTKHRRKIDFVFVFHYTTLSSHKAIILILADLYLKHRIFFTSHPVHFNT